MVVNEDICTPGLLEYALRNNLLPDATLSDMRGDEYGWQLMQENIDFMARCFRRDIRKQEVFCPRRNVPLPSNDEEPRKEEDDELLSLKDFLAKIRDTKEFVSTANKHWKLVKATQSVVSVKDDRRKVVEIDTDGLYEAYCSLESYEFGLTTSRNMCIGIKLPRPWPYSTPPSAMVPSSPVCVRCLIASVASRDCQSYCAIGISGGKKSDGLECL